MQLFTICFLVLTIYFQTNVIKIIFSLYLCTRLYRTDESEEYLIADYGIKCWNAEHNFWAYAIGLPNIFLWGFILPSFFFIKLYNNRTHLQQERIMKKYAFLYMVYNRRYYYWEIVLIWRKFVFILSLVFIAPISANLHLTLSLLLSLIFLVANILLKPFENPRSNNLETLFNIMITTAIIIGIYFTNVNDLFGFFDIIMIIIGLTLFGISMISWACQYFLTLKEKFKLIFNKLKEEYKDKAYFRKVFSLIERFSIMDNPTSISIANNLSPLKDKPSSISIVDKSLSICIMASKTSSISLIDKPPSISLKDNPSSIRSPESEENNHCLNEYSEKNMKEYEKNFSDPTNLDASIEPKAKFCLSFDSYKFMTNLPQTRENNTYF